MIAKLNINMMADEYIKFPTTGSLKPQTLQSEVGIYPQLFSIFNCMNAK